MFFEPMTFGAIAAALVKVAAAIFADQQQRHQLSDLKDSIQDSIKKAVEDIKKYIDQTNEANKIQECQNNVTAAFDLMVQYQQSNDSNSSLNKERLANAVIKATESITTLKNIGPTKAFGAYIQSVSLFSLAITLEYKHTHNKKELKNLEKPFADADVVILAFEKEINDLLQYKLDGISEIKERRITGWGTEYYFEDRINPGWHDFHREPVEQARVGRINWYKSLRDEAIRDILIPGQAVQSQWHGLWQKCKKLIDQH